MLLFSQSPPYIQHLCRSCCEIHLNTAATLSSYSKESPMSTDPCMQLLKLPSELLGPTSDIDFLL